MDARAFRGYPGLVVELSPQKIVAWGLVGLVGLIGVVLLAVHLEAVVAWAEAGNTRRGPGRVVVGAFAIPALVSLIGVGLAFDQRHRVRLADGRVLRSVDSRRFRVQPGLAERIHADVASGDLGRIRAWLVPSNRGGIDVDLRAAKGDDRGFVAITRRRGEHPRGPLPTIELRGHVAAALLPAWARRDA